MQRSFVSSIRAVLPATLFLDADSFNVGKCDVNICKGIRVRIIASVFQFVNFRNRRFIDSFKLRIKAQLNPTCFTAKNYSNEERFSLVGFLFGIRD